MRRIFYLFFLISFQSYAQSNTDCFSIEPGQVIEVPDPQRRGSVRYNAGIRNKQWNKVPVHLLFPKR